MTPRQVELDRRRAYVVARETTEAAERARFVADPEAELHEAWLKMLREGWF